MINNGFKTKEKEYDDTQNHVSPDPNMCIKRIFIILYRREPHVILSNVDF